MIVTVTPSPAAVDASGAPASLVIVGGDGVAPGGTLCWDDTLPNPRKGCAITYSIPVAASGTVTFDWAYVSSDNSGSALYDIFGYAVDGVRTQFTNDGGATTQSGSATVAVSAGQTIGFWLDCGDCGYGNAVVSVTGFSAPAARANEAAAIPLLGLPGLSALAGALGLLAMARLRRRR